MKTPFNRLFSALLIVNIHAINASSSSNDNPMPQAGPTSSIGALCTEINILQTNITNYNKRIRVLCPNQEENRFERAPVTDDLKLALNHNEEHARIVALALIVKDRSREMVEKRTELRDMQISNENNQTIKEYNSLLDELLTSSQKQEIAEIRSKTQSPEVLKFIKRQATAKRSATPVTPDNNSDNNTNIKKSARIATKQNR